MGIAQARKGNGGVWKGLGPHRACEGVALRFPQQDFSRRETGGQRLLGRQHLQDLDVPDAVDTGVGVKRKAHRSTCPGARMSLRGLPMAQASKVVRVEASASASRLKSRVNRLLCLKQNALVARSPIGSPWAAA